MTHSILIIGCGYSGLRFYRVMEYFRASDPDFAILSGVVDLDPNKFSGLPSDVRTFTDLTTALKTVKPTVAIVAVNEEKHAIVLDALSRSDVQIVLTEKPLTSSLADARSLKRKLEGKIVSMNMVERFSPAVANCRQWLNDRPYLTTSRVEFFWGKHRVKDIRPSMGVCSEVIHPLDLIRLIFNPEAMKLKTAFGIESDLSGAKSLNTERVMDSICVLYDTSLYPIFGHSSFAWPTRDRRIISYAGNGNNLYRLCLNFDAPKWDCDTFDVVKIDNDGRYEPVHTFAVENRDFPKELEQIFKVKEFVENSLKYAEDYQSDVPIVTCAEAVELQQVLEEIDNVASRAETVFGGSFVSNQKPSLISRAV